METKGYYAMSFYNTTDTMQTEKKAKALFPIQVMPTPRAISQSCGLALRCAPPEGAVRTIAAALAGPAAGVGLFCILRGLGYPEGADLSLLYTCVNLLPVLPLDGGRALHAAVTALAGERAAERQLDALGLVLPVALMGFGVVLFARGMGLALGMFGAWLALLQPGMTCQGGKHDVKYSYYHM